MITSDMLEGLAAAPPIPSDPDPLNAPQAPPQSYDPFQQAARQIETLLPNGIAGELVDQGKSPLDTPLQSRDPVTGQFVKSEADDPIIAAPEEGEPAPDPEAAPAEPEVPVVDTITVLDRNGKELPIEITDPEAAEALRMLKNNGMRKEEFLRQAESVAKERREFREFKAMIATPESLADQLPIESQMRMLNYMLANHWETLKPQLEDWYQNDISRERYQVQAERQKMTQASEVSAAMANGDRVDAINLKIDALVPDTASHQDAMDFIKLASVEIGDAERAQGRAIQPQEIPALLERHLARFGFTQPTAQTPSTTPGSLLPVTPAVAAPQGAKAEEIAKKAQAHKARMTSLPQQQLAARSTAPAGTGVAPAIAPKARNLDEAAQMIANIYRQSGRS